MRCSISALLLPPVYAITCVFKSPLDLSKPKPSAFFSLLLIPGGFYNKILKEQRKKY
jgi:hypothetical protein